MTSCLWAEFGERAGYGSGLWKDETLSEPILEVAPFGKCVRVDLDE
jgi:hypothetical protein